MNSTAIIVPLIGTLFLQAAKDFITSAVWLRTINVRLTRTLARVTKLRGGGLFGELHFGYVDTVAQVGAMTEVIEGRLFLRELYARVAEAALGWPGERLVRDLAELM